MWSDSIKENSCSIIKYEKWYILYITSKKIIFKKMNCWVVLVLWCFTSDPFEAASKGSPSLLYIHTLLKTIFLALFQILCLPFSFKLCFENMCSLNYTMSKEAFKFKLLYWDIWSKTVIVFFSVFSFGILGKSMSLMQSTYCKNGMPSQ